MLCHRRPLHRAVLAVLCCSATAAAQDCSLPIELNLSVLGAGSSNGTVRFLLSGATPDMFAMIALGTARGVNVSPVVNLCIDPIALLLPMSAVDDTGCAEATIALPPLPAGFAFRTFVQAVGAPPGFPAGSVKTSNPAPLDLYGAAPFTVASVTPNTGGPGAIVTIRGAGFGTDPRQVTVWIGATPVPPTAVANDMIHLVLPHLQAGGAVPLQVQVGVPRVDAGPFTAIQGRGPGLVPGWVGVSYPTTAAANAASVDDAVRAAGGRVLDLDLVLQNALCTVVPGREAAFGAAMLARGASAVRQDEFADYSGVGDRGSPNDPQRGNQWYLDLVGRSTKTGPVAPLLVTIDSGLDLVHPDIAGRRFVTRAITDFIDHDDTPQDLYGHGTTVAGVMIANADNGLHVTGMVPELQLLPMRVSGDPDTDSWMMRGRAMTHAVTMFRLFRDRRPLVMNISMRLPDFDEIRKALVYADTNGVAVVMAAGNNAGEVEYATPTSVGYPDIVIASGIARDRDLVGKLQLSGGPQGSSWTTAPLDPSRRWREVDIAAPSEAIVTLLPGNNNTNNAQGGAYGTSYAAPQVSAALAAVWSWTPRGPGEPLTAWRDRVIDMLLGGCVRDIGDFGRDQLFGNGVLDLSGRVLFHSRNDRVASTRHRREISPTNTTGGLVNGRQVRDYGVNQGMNPAYRADRRAMAVDVWNATAGRSEIVIREIDPAEGFVVGAPRVINDVSSVGQAAFDPRTGRWICFVWRNEIWAMNLVTQNRVKLWGMGPDVKMTPHWSPSGSHVLVADVLSITAVEVLRDGNGDVTGGGNLDTILWPDPNVDEYTAAWAPDSNYPTGQGRIVWARRWSDPVAGRTWMEIYTMRQDGTNLQRLTSDGWRTAAGGSENFGPGYTPDGARILFHTLEYDNTGLSRHRVRAIPASPPVAGYDLIEDLYDSGWSIVPVPMGIRATPLYYSSVDPSRF